MKVSLRIVLLVAAAILIAGGGVLAYAQLNGGIADHPVVCSMEAKICPDGTAVGRSGPSCEFAACPPGKISAADTIGIGDRATINGTTIGVLGLTEDSRCPVDVQCIQAGTVRVRAAINALNSDFTFTLGKSQTVGDATITLVSVIPAEKYSKQTIQSSDYLFTFSVTRADTAISGSGITGTVLEGPMCPVEQYPPNPQCADRGYAATISIYRGNSLQLFATTQSDGNGIFSIALAPGVYTVAAKGPGILPRCSSVTVTVTNDVYAIANISCDSGIR